MTKIYLAPTVYEKIIKENPEEFKDSEQLEDFINAYLGTDKSVKELEDSLSEYADGLVPVYYNKIMEEWADNSECHEMTPGSPGRVYREGDYLPNDGERLILLV